MKEFFMVPCDFVLPGLIIFRNLIKDFENLNKYIYLTYYLLRIYNNY